MIDFKFILFSIIEDGDSIRAIGEIKKIKERWNRLAYNYSNCIEEERNKRNI